MRAHRLRILALAAIAVPLAVPVRAEVAYRSIVSDRNQAGATVTNHGYLGNNFVSRSPSFEYPLGSGYEHLTHAGLWFGAHAIDAAGAFTGVVTGVVEVSTGSAGAMQTEWTPTSEFLRRSNLPSSPFFDPAAISEGDILTTYDDHVVKRASGTYEDHRPMGVEVRQRALAWSSLGREHVLYLRFVIRNTGTQPLTGAWAGLYAEFASGDKNAYGAWPPSSTSGPGSWFRKKWIAWDDTMRLFREHFCFGQPVPDGCRLAAVPPWVGLKLLTRPAAGQGVTLAAWPYAPGSTLRDQDVERYALMSTGVAQSLAGSDLQPSTGDPVELVALGPFATIAPGDSVRVDFALVGGADLDALWSHANDAQALHDAGYLDGVTGVAASLVAAEASPDVVRLRWSSGGAAAADVERSDDGAAWARLGAAVPEGADELRWEDRTVRAGARYAYRLRLRDGATTAPAWVQVPQAARFALHGARPNPLAAGDPVVAFALPGSGRAEVALFDLAGRRVRGATLESPAAGEHLVRLAGPAPLATGVYTLRLAQGARIATAKLSVVR